MATGVYKRGDYQFQACIRVEGQPAIYRTFETVRDASSWRTEVLRKIKRGEIDDLDPTTQKITVKEAVTSYRAKVLPTLARQGKGTGDVHLKRIEAKFGPLFVSALRSPAINVWTASLASGDDNLGAQSIIHHLNTFSSLIRHAQTVLGVHIPAGNPLKLVDRPKLPRGRDRVLRPGEYELLMRAASAPDILTGLMLKSIIKLALATSMRQGELLALHYDWIDLQLRVISLPADSTKNGTGRTVALSSEAVDIVSALPRHINGRVFGAWKNASSFSKPWQRLLSRARSIYATDCEEKGTNPDPKMLVDLRFHDLRHHATTQLFAKGLNAFEVASMTGHKSMQMLKRYTHIEAVKLAQKLG